MKLEKLHILQRHSRSQRHTHAVTRVDQRVGRCTEQLAGSARGQQRRFRLDNDRFAVVYVERQRAEHTALLILEQVDREILVEKMRLGAYVLLVQAVQNCVAGAIGSGTGPGGLVTAEILALAAKRPLVDTTVVEP